MHAHSFTLLAQGGTSASGGAAAPTVTTTTPATTPAGQPPAPGIGGLGQFMPIFLVMMVLLFLLPMLTNRKEKKKRDAMMSALKRGDKVLTIGGILGTIDQIKDDEIILKVDPNSNSKIAFTRSAIQQVVSASQGSTVAESNGAVEVKAKNGATAAAR